MSASPTSEPATILVVEDDRALREGLELNFRLRGYAVVSAADGDRGLAAALAQGPDLIVLDLMLPGPSGLDILAELRGQGDDVPVLVLTARGRLEDKLEGLGEGADDYLTKPFQLPELLARVEALLRRSRAVRSASSRLGFGAVEVDPSARRVTVGGAEVAMSAKELDLLCLLVRSPRRVLSRETILDRVWGIGFDGTERTVDNFIRALRLKVEPDPARPRHIVTVRHVGYRFEP